MPKTQYSKQIRFGLEFWISNFEFVSEFELRISDLIGVCSTYYGPERDFGLTR
jgi:hypothetical protein